MKLLFDFFPILLFFIVYKKFGIYPATSVVILASTLQVLFSWFKYRRIDSLLLVTSAIVVLLGTITLLWQDDIFIKWKPTVIYWLTAIVFLISQYIGKKNMIQRILGSNIEAPPTVWLWLNLSWVIFFAVLGTANIYVIYHYSTDTWVNFKLIGIMGLTLVFIIGQALFLARFIQEKSTSMEQNK
jgi:intracellular septation protein